jgi:TDG/mug DNA glycosylase family protein
LVIADEHLGTDPSNRLKYESSQAEGAQLPGMFHNSNGSNSSSNDSKTKGEKPPRKKHNRFNGMSEEEVAKKILPDLITPDLDILIIGINPGMYAAFKGHHYAGPGNHFWKCMFLSGLLPRPMTAEDDRKLLEHGIGFTNIVERTTKGTANLTRREIEEGNVSLTQKIQHYRPKIAVFNGKGIMRSLVTKRSFTLVNNLTK